MITSVGVWSTVIFFQEEVEYFAKFFSFLIQYNYFFFFSDVGGACSTSGS